MQSNLKNNSGVHLPHPFMDYTLCSDALEGDGDELTISEETTDPVDCKKCLQIVNFCVEFNNGKSRKARAR